MPATPKTVTRRHSRALIGGLELPAQQRELARPADERSVEPPGERLGALDRLEHAPRLDRVALALRRDRVRRLELSGVLDETARRLADQDLVGGGCLLEALRGVDRVAGDERRRAVAGRRPHRC